MAEKGSPGVASDLRGASRLVVEAALGVAGMAEQTHRSILHLKPFAAPAEGGAGATGFVYRCVRGVMRLTGAALDATLARLAPLLDRIPPSPARDSLLAALNGVLGDHLAATNNPLALRMQLRQGGREIALDAASLAALAPTGRIVVLVHGLCVSDLQWRRKGQDHGEKLAKRLGFTPVYLLYNSGLHISQNGRAASELLERLVETWPAPVESLAIVGHSMGGLVARSACHHGDIAGHAWRRRLDRLVCLGTPHHGAPLERIGAWIDLVVAGIPFAAAFARLGRVRSAGIADLRHGSLVEEDWRDRDPLALADTRRPIPLPANVQCFVIAATTSATPGGLNDRLVGDGLVTVASALGRHRNPARELGFPPDRQWIACGMNHFDLLDRAEVYERIESWLAP